jgi:hypothetical protein
MSGLWGAGLPRGHSVQQLRPATRRGLTAPGFLNYRPQLQRPA